MPDIRPVKYCIRPAYLESLGEGEGDGLAGVLPEDGGRGVPVLKVLLLNIHISRIFFQISRANSICP